MVYWKILSLNLNGTNITSILSKNLINCDQLRTKNLKLPVSKTFVHLYVSTMFVCSRLILIHIESKPSTTRKFLVHLPTYRSILIYSCSNKSMISNIRTILPVHRTWIVALFLHPTLAFTPHTTYITYPPSNIAEESTRPEWMSSQIFIFTSKSLQREKTIKKKVSKCRGKLQCWTQNMGRKGYNFSGVE